VNLQALSRGCHHRKTAGAWTATHARTPDREDTADSEQAAAGGAGTGVVHWTTLAGRDYLTYPKNWREALTDPGTGPPRDQPPRPGSGPELEPPPPF